MQIPAQDESRAQNQIQLMLSQPINTETFKVRADWGVGAQVAQIQDAEGLWIEI